MSSLSFSEKDAFERLFNMSSGYVLDFSNSSFQQFVRETVNIDIYGGNGYENDCSKANKLRQIWTSEKDDTVGKLLDELLNCYENSQNVAGVSIDTTLLKKSRLVTKRLISNTTDLSPSDTIVTSAITKFDITYVKGQWDKALERRQTDPEAAITSARTLLETVCKYILDNLNIIYEDSLEFPKLYSLTANQLNLAPENHEEQIFKQILGGCISVVNGLGSLRNKISDAHGKGAKYVKPTARHAELAVNLSGAMASFLITTFDAKTATEANSGQSI